MDEHYELPMPLFHMDMSEMGIEELYSEMPEPSVLSEDEQRLNTLTQAEEQELDEWLGRLDQELST